jgi:hypothetical protein
MDVGVSKNSGYVKLHISCTITTLPDEQNHNNFSFIQLYVTQLIFIKKK